jgi:maltose alpha-D-glucosyltransferase / alpha-amylase
MSEPRWYQDAIIYELHVRSFQDSDGDGIGDFRGLTERLDYLQDLGVTAVWLLPFYPSPLRDDGYDIADYRSINPAYGTMGDFKRFLRAAHERNLRVITELVINHTSDQHPWFQRARLAAPGTVEREFYVWSDTPDRYADARIIFQDTETSNWSWDPVAGAYYWHRFFSHQPDLNFENPAVHRAIYGALDHWLDLGVDGLRLDAVPYLYEEEGTMCENLPATHEFLRRLRSRVDTRYEDRMLLAEANQWPEEAVAYFGDGDECHMCFHFPLMPRLFMAVRMENRFPIIDILDQTPPAPEGAAWAIFLRNHDELTLEMVTDEERDYMYRVYARDRQARINLGIRRRLAPLLGNNRRELELMNALLFSLPGTPVLYYGDEIGMGDNIYLGDRDSVRTPMQWSADRNAGFSRANPQRLYLPVITDPEYHYEAVNVEAQQANANSLWWWMKRMITLRRSIPALSAGALEFLTPDNPKVLAFERRLDGESVLVAANLSRHVQAAELDLGHHAGLRPVEVFGRAPFPAIGDRPYPLTLGPHAFYWFRMAVRERIDLGDGHPRIRLRSDDADVFRARTQLARALLEDHVRRTPADESGRLPTVADVEDVIELAGSPIRFVVMRLEGAGDEPVRLALYLGLVKGEEAERLLEATPEQVAAVVTGTGETAVLAHRPSDPSLAASMVRLMAGRRTRRGGRYGLRGTTVGPSRPAVEEPSVAVVEADSDGTRVALDDRYFLRLLHRLEEGPDPEVETALFLTERAGFDHTPAGRGVIYLQRGTGETAVALLQDHVAHQGTAWGLAVDAVRRFVDEIAATAGGPPFTDDRLHPLDLVGAEPPEALATALGSMLPDMELLGRRTVALHLALASHPDDPAFAPEHISTLYLRSLYQAMRSNVRQSFQAMRRSDRTLAPDVVADADRLLGREDEILERLRDISSHRMDGWRIRTVGDHRLERVLYTGNDFVILAGGDRWRPPGERRIKRSAVYDLAAMIRSLRRAARVGFRAEAVSGVLGADVDPEWTKAWADAWWRWSAAAFLDGHLSEVRPGEVVPADREHLRLLLDAFLVDGAASALGRALAAGDRDAVTDALEGLASLLG